MKKYYVVLTGAKKNAGDFLITEKCKELLRKEKPDYDLIQLNRWESLNPHLDIVNNSEAVILMGGPALTENLYPNVYKLTPNLDDIKVPIVPMAVGWNSVEGDFSSTLTYNFTKESIQLLDRFKNNGIGISVRDSYTASILRNNQINNIFLTGCASWYTPEKFGEENKEVDIKKIAVTPAQDPKYLKLSMTVLEVVKKKFPNTEIVCAFHRGIGKIDEYTSAKDAKNTQLLSDFAKQLGMNCIDLAYSYSNYKKYDDIDLHIGFRVHAHLYFLSNRKPSILMHEDGRGKAMSETIGLAGVDVFKKSIVRKPSDFSNKVFNKLNLSVESHPEVDYESIDKLNHTIDTHINNNYLLMNGVYKNFDNNYSIMKKFMSSLP